MDWMEVETQAEKRRDGEVRWRTMRKKIIMDSVSWILCTFCSLAFLLIALSRPSLSLAAASLGKLNE